MRAPVRYWGRKAGVVLERVQAELRSRLKPPALVVDPFAGAGSIGQHLLKLGYRVVLLDINLYAWLISRTLIGRVRVPSQSFWSAFESLTLRIVTNGRKRLVPWRHAFAAKCGSTDDIIIRRDCSEEEKLCVVHTMRGCRIVAEYGDDGIDEILDYYPKLPLRYPDGAVFEKKRSRLYLHEFYSPLMLAGMAAIARLLLTRRYSLRGRVGSLLWLALAAIAYNSSKMARKNTGAWAINSYWIPREHSEYNPFLRFRRRVLQIAIST